MDKEILENGNIRAGESCPFIENCTWKNENCPSKENNNIREKPFSCAIARWFVIFSKTKTGEK
jgi:hypothetical protein